MPIIVPVSSSKGETGKTTVDVSRGSAWLEADAYCAAEDIPNVDRIPPERRIAERYSDGMALVEPAPEYGEQSVGRMERLSELWRERVG